MSDSRSSPGLFLLVVLTLMLVLLYQLRPVLTPFLMGALIAYLGDPVTDWLERRGCGRSTAAALVFSFFGLLLLGVILVMLPLLLSQINTLIQGVPAAYEWLIKTVLPWVREALDLPEEVAPRLAVKQTITENWRSLSKLLAAAGRYVSDSSMNLFVFVGNLVLIPVVAFYLLRDWDKLVPRVMQLLPRDWQDKAEELTGECDEVIGAFLRGQFMVMLALGVIYSLGLMIVGLDLAVLIGTIAGLASVVPYLGFIVGIAAAAVAAFVQFQAFSALVGVAVVFGVGQLIESYLLTPNLVGDRIGMHPVAVIFVILAGGQLAGFEGVLLALPVGAVVLVLLRHVDDYYKATEFYSGEDQDDR